MILLIALLTALVIGFVGAPLAVWVVWGVLASLFLFWPLLFVVIPISLVFLIPDIRRKYITANIFNFIKNKGLIPKVSETEETALRAGTNWIEADLFSGKPDFAKIFAEPYPDLSADEKTFMETKVDQVCKMTSDWEIFRDRDLSPKVWEFLKKEKFFGMIIPKEYGGLGFTALGHSAVVQKLATRSQVLAITTMVPNSLGPGELLHRYGTDAQKKYYLPRLADGRDIPCFALTEPTAGSDAASIISRGEAFKDADGKIKIKVNFQKRYITLGAVATVLGLAFRLYDPKNLLGHGKEPGITCALLPGDLPGIKRGRRHDPMGVPFVNSPLWGEDVIIDTSMIIGEDSGIGKGWLMLMECLAVGRGISLPSTSAGGGKLIARVVGNYCLVRKQFGLSIGKFEAIEEPMARIAGFTYMIDAMRKFVAGAVDRGAKPAVTNAISKYHTTEKFRTIVNDGMDILGGAAISRGPRNMLAHAYMGVPVGITVEGANIMTRGLIQFGQGAIRCHPYSYLEMKALMNDDLAAFDHNFWAHVGHLVRNKSRMIVFYFTRGLAHVPTQKGIVGKYERKLAWASAKYAYITDVALAMFGGGMKMKESLGGRFGDVLSYMLMAACVLRRYQAEGERKEDEACVKWLMEYCFAEMQKAFEGANENMGLPFRIINFFSRINPIGVAPSDWLTHKLANKLISSADFRDNLTTEIHMPEDNKEHLKRLENAFHSVAEMEGILNRIKQASKDKKLPRGKPDALVKEAVAADVITKEEADALKKAQSLWLDAVMVDSYEIEDYLSFQMKTSS
jgi:acyl-CoA dehydrogenase